MDIDWSSLLIAQMSCKWIFFANLCFFIIFVCLFTSHSYTVMTCCWLEDHAQRPSFGQLIAYLQDFHEDLSKYI